MKHEFTTEDLEHAISQAHKRSFDMPAINPSELRFILDALPDQDDEWKQCSFKEIRTGDRVREVVKQDHGTIQTTEGVASYIDSRGTRDTWKTRDGIELALEDYIMDSHMVTLYRIPAPVVHPDPAEHPVILIREAVVKHDPPVVAIAMRERVCNELIYVFGEYGSLSPTKITSWSPAKVVADDE